MRESTPSSSLMPSPEIGSAAEHPSPRPTQSRPISYGSTLSAPSVHSLPHDDAHYSPDLLPPHPNQFGMHNSRPTSYSSTASLSSLGGRVQLGGSPRVPSNGYASDRDPPPVSDAAEELMLERNQDQNQDAYAFERPLDTVKRHSKMYDFSPVHAAPREQRMSILPAGFDSFLDPYGFTNAITSPYDSAMPYARTRRPASNPNSRYPSSSDVSTASNATTALATSSAATSPLPWRSEGDNATVSAPWQKRRSVSMGEEERMQSQSQPRRPGYLASNLSSETARGPSKLSAEIIQVESSLSSPTRMSADDTDYTKSELYRRTQKAMEKLENEGKKKEHSGGGVIKSLSRASSFVTEPTSAKTKRRTFGWFKSNSATTLPLSQSTPPSAVTPTSVQSSKTIPNGTPVVDRRNSSSERRSSNAGLFRSHPVPPAVPDIPQEHARRSTPTPSPPLSNPPASPARLTKAISTVLPSSPAPSPPIHSQSNEQPRQRKSPLQEMLPLPLTNDHPPTPSGSTSPPSSSESFSHGQQSTTKKLLSARNDSLPEKHVLDLESNRIIVAGVGAKENVKGAPTKPGFFNRARKSFSGPIFAGKLPSPAKSTPQITRRQSIIKPNRSPSTKKQSRNSKGSMDSVERPRKTSFFGSFSRSTSSSSLAARKAPKSTAPAPPLPTQRPALSSSQASDRPPRENRPSITNQRDAAGFKTDATRRS